MKANVIDLKEASPKIAQTVKEFDEHLIVSGGGTADGFSLRFLPKNAKPPAAYRAASGEYPRRRIRVGGNVQQTKLISQPRPVYPPEAKAAGIQGVVRLTGHHRQRWHHQEPGVDRGAPAPGAGRYGRGEAMGLSAHPALRQPGRGDHADRCELHALAVGR